jgi:hypothetical protein
LIAIADKCATTVKQLAVANHIANVNSIMAGKRLEIPGCVSQVGS